MILPHCIVKLLSNMLSGKAQPFNFAAGCRGCWGLGASEKIGSFATCAVVKHHAPQALSARYVSSLCGFTPAGMGVQRKSACIAAWCEFSSRFAEKTPRSIVSYCIAAIAATPAPVQLQRSFVSISHGEKPYYTAVQIGYNI